MSFASDSRHLRRCFTNAGVSDTSVATIEDLAALLAGCTGTENHYRHPVGRLIYTDGMLTMAEAVSAYWLIDLIASHASTIKRTAPGTWAFGIVRLAVAEIDGRRSAHFDWREDTDTTPVLHQDIDYTDFPVGIFECYVIEGIALLKSEY